MSNLYIVGPGGNRCGGGAGCCFRSPCLDAEENITGSRPIIPHNLVVSEQIQGVPILFQMVLSTWGKATRGKLCYVLKKGTGKHRGETGSKREMTGTCPVSLI